MLNCYIKDREEEKTLPLDELTTFSKRVCPFE